MGFGRITLELTKQFSSNGFMWSSNTPYLRPIWVRVRRMCKGPAGTMTGATVGRDANPASIIYECMADTDWGIGIPYNLIDYTSFNEAAARLHSESFGMSLVWSNESELESFIGTILDHIDGVLFVHPRTGKHTLKLIRSDYNVDNLRVINPDNARMMSFQRRGWGETTNEMKVTWTNPVNEKEETVSLQDIGNIAQQGSVISGSKNFFGVRNPGLAMRLCARELRKTSSPTATCELRVTREFWDVIPGEVVKITWPEYNMVAVVMRVLEVNYGAPGDSWITLKLSEDVFSLPQAQYVVPPSSKWEDPSSLPEAITDVEVMTLPAYVASGLAGVSVSQFNYPEVLSGVLAATENVDASNFELMTQETLPNGSLSWEVSGTKQFMGHSTIPVALTQEPETVVQTLEQPTSGLGPVESSLMIIGPDSLPMSEREIAMVWSIGETGYTLRRGVLDTVPKEWPADTPVWYVYPGANILDTAVRSDGESVDYKLLMSTSRGQFNVNDANVVTGFMDDRPYLPNRPGNVKLQGEPFEEVIYEYAGTTDTLNVTWSRRNRVTEEQVVVGWSDPDITPENGQTTTVYALSFTEGVVTEHNDVTGTSFDLPVGSFEVNGEIPERNRVKVTAKRDGFESLQGHEIQLRLLPPDVFLTEDGGYLTDESGDDLFYTEEPVV